MHGHSRPPLPKYAKYLPEYEPDLLAAQRPTLPSQWRSVLKTISIILGMLCVNTSIYLIASLILAPPAPYHDESVGAAKVTWVVFGLLPGLVAFLCWSLYTASESTQS